MDTAIYIKGLDDTEKYRFQKEFDKKGKSRVAGVWWAIGLGGIGSHRFYLGQTGMGFLYILFVWTWIPMILGVIEGIFLMDKRVDAYNDALAEEIVLKLKAMR